MNKDIAPSAWSAQDVWAAAVLATRVNNGYNKTSEYDQHGRMVRMQNKALMLKALEDTTQIPEDDYITGEQARNYIINRCVLRTLKGKAGDFDLAVSKVASKEYFSITDRYDIAIIASQIVSYQSGIREEQVLSQVDRSLGFVGQLGDSVEILVRPYRVVWSENYGTYYFWALTDKKQLVSFNFKNRLSTSDAYWIRGRIKAHREDTTVINRVKLVDK